MIIQRKPEDTITIVVPSNPKYLRAVRSLVDEVTYEMGFSVKSRSEVIQAIDEACTNIIKHSYDGNFKKKIIITLQDHNNRLEVMVKDFGKKVHPARIRHRELYDIKPGGLGVYLIKQYMDVVWYDISPRVGTELKMVKYLKKPKRHH
ncbi:MAG: ATP-binding protein [Candidatus Aureabacteria bacterium]|nr:ATP-binding protein [Candidatus Auribacterota bacterium]